jgi:hypothetical protein
MSDMEKTDLKRCVSLLFEGRVEPRDDRLRQPVFLGIREDQNAKEVVREKEETVQLKNRRFAQIGKSAGKSV